MPSSRGAFSKPPSFGPDMTDYLKGFGPPSGNQPGSVAQTIGAPVNWSALKEYAKLLGMGGLSTPASAAEGAPTELPEITATGNNPPLPPSRPEGLGMNPGSPAAMPMPPSRPGDLGGMGGMGSAQPPLPPPRPADLGSPPGGPPPGYGLAGLPGAQMYVSNPMGGLGGSQPTPPPSAQQPPLPPARPSDLGSPGSPYESYQYQDDSGRPVWGSRATGSAPGFGDTGQVMAGATPSGPGQPGDGLSSFAGSGAFADFLKLMKMGQLG